MSVYLRNVKSMWKLHKSGRWFNERNIYNYLCWYTIKYILK